MKRFIPIALAFFLGLIFAQIACQNDAPSANPSESPAADGQAIAWVNGTPIAKATFDQMIAQMPPFMAQQLSTAQGVKDTLDNLIGMELVYQKAKKEGFDKKPEVQEKIQETLKQIISGLYMQEAVANLPEPAEEEAKAFYEGNPNLSSKPYEEVKGRIMQLLSRQKQKETFDKMIESLRGGAEIKYNEEIIQASVQQAPAMPPTMPGGMPPAPPAPPAEGTKGE